MNKFIDLKIYSPCEILIDSKIQKITFQGKEGYLTILPNHVDYVSSFESNIITLTNMEGYRKFMALNNGVLVKYSNKIRITAYKGIIENSIESLRTRINEIIENENNLEKEINKNLKQLEYYLFNNLSSI